MATVKEMKAAARSRAGKGAAGPSAAPAAYRA